MQNGEKSQDPLTDFLRMHCESSTCDVNARGNVNQSALLFWAASFFLAHRYASDQTCRGTVTLSSTEDTNRRHSSG